MLQDVICLLLEGEGAKTGKELWNYEAVDLQSWFVNEKKEKRKLPDG